MIFSVWIPLLVPFLAVPAARRLAEALPPRPAAWLLAAAAAGLALCSTAALGLIALAGALRLPFVASLGHLAVPLDALPAWLAFPAAATAAALVALSATALVRTVRRHMAELRVARARLRPAGSELAVLRDPNPDAYALPGRPGRIVVTTGMLRTLEPAEREALFAHERAHLQGRHHLFLAVAELAGHCHPGLRPLRAPLAFALERSADEYAAAAVGDRGLAARAIGRAALASRAAVSRPRAVLAATAGPVPRRVAALLERHPAKGLARSPGARLIAAVLLGCLCASAASAIDAAADLHGGIETAQGETGHDRRATDGPKAAAPGAVTRTAQQR
ncbi:M56 family metallopeptidase [Streptomyces sp. NBC_00083]|uniref:M56 family metallopeptidase n=1 Tax=Streptomyces sp. NBC_00083 TaxID=2975647 RepID=UPI00225BB2EA|nr:M56 family metallopeptidase [Streptomyces sp. NBC_00083]MCX5386855.1 M56 family metallopeptidase [Streptomyces sp. NBC_00083]